MDLVTSELQNPNQALGTDHIEKPPALRKYRSCSRLATKSFPVDALMPPRRSRQLKSLKGRVQKLVTRDDHEKLLRKSKKRLVVILYYTVRVKWHAVHSSKSSV